jgi:hypothetical protein
VKNGHRPLDRDFCGTAVVVSNRPQTASGEPIFGKPNFLAMGLILIRRHRRNTDRLYTYPGVHHGLVGDGIILGWLVGWN